MKIEALYAEVLCEIEYVNGLNCLSQELDDMKVRLLYMKIELEKKMGIIEDYSNMTKIGRDLGISKERVKQILKKSIFKMKKKSKKLVDYA